MSHRGDLTERLAMIPVLLTERSRTQRELAEQSRSSVATYTSRHRATPESTTIEMRVASGRGLMRFILGWGNEVEVLFPESLRQEVAAAHQRALERYELAPADEDWIE